MANTRDTLYQRGTRKIDTEAARTGEALPIEGTHEALTNREGSGRQDAAEFSLDKTYTETVQDVGPVRQIISRMPGKWEIRLRRLATGIDAAIILTSRIIFTLWDLRPWREKTPQEIEKEAEMKKRRKMRRILRREAREFMRRAANAYHRMGLSYTPPIQRRSLLNGTKKITFSNVVAERNAIWLQIDTARLPYGVDLLRLVDDDHILTNVSSSLRHHVQAVYDVERGAWLCIERGRGVRGIPQIVTYEKMMNLKPADAHGLTIPLGETVNSRRIYRNIRDFPHFLVGGATGRGKTSYLNVILAALIENNTPEELRIVLVDLKGGIEFDMYTGIPHLWKIGGLEDEKGQELPEDELIAPSGIVGRSDKVLKLLERLKVEGERRLEYFKRAKVTNIDEYNARRTKSRMDRIVIVFDEWARVALSPDGYKADQLLSDITATYRAVGFHVILATQTPITRVISTLIKTNFNARLAFGVPDNTGSIVILDNGRARGLSPVGRAIFKYGIMEVETQVPLITKPELLRILAEARADGGAVEEELSLLDICRYSLENLDGSLAIQRIYEQFREYIGKNALQDKLRSLDDLLIDIDGVEYVIVPPNQGNIPRMIKPYRKELPQETATDQDPPTPPTSEKEINQ